MDPAPDRASRAPARLLSLDALRGFDMFWIVGGREVVLALTAAFGWSEARALLERHVAHAEWHGFRAWDLVFPLFLFLAGVSTSFSFALRRARGATEATLARHALQRALGLVLLGAIYNGLLRFDLEQQRWASVLGRIGLAWLGAALLALWLGPRGRPIAAVVILVVYWLLMTAVPVPGIGAGDLEQGRNLADWLDQRYLPGRLHAGNHDPEGLFATLPAIATALFGITAGDWLRRTELGAGRRALGLAVAGASALALGYAWGLVFPLNKRLWTSSFVFVCAGWSALLLALAFTLFDVLRWERLGRVLAIVGAHALAAYMLRRFVDYDGVAQTLLGRATRLGLLHEALLPVAALTLLWTTVWGYGALQRRTAKR